MMPPRRTGEKRRGLGGTRCDPTFRMVAEFGEALFLSLLLTVIASIIVPILVGANFPLGLGHQEPKVAKIIRRLEGKLDFTYPFCFCPMVLS